MRIKKSVLKFWAALVAKVLPTTQFSLPIHKAIVLKANESGGVTVYANSEYNALMLVNIPAQDVFPEVAVSADGLVHACVGESDELHLDFSDDHTILNVVSKKTRFSLEVADMSTFEHPALDPELAFVDCGSVKKDKFISLLKSAGPFLSKDISRPYVMGVLLVGKYMYATTITSIMRTESGYNFAEGINFIPQGVLEVLGSGSKDDADVHIAVSETWVRFTAGKVTFFTKRHGTEGEFDYPALDSELLSIGTHTGSAKINLESLRKALASTEYFAKEFVRVILDRKGSRLEAFHNKRVIAKAPFTGTYQHATALEIVFEIAQIKSMLSIDAKEITMRVQGSLESVGFSVDNVNYLMLPAVLDDTTFTTSLSASAEGVIDDASSHDGG